MKLENAIFGAGCFWHVEHIFSQIKGVTDTRVGYSGGTKKNPKYKDVCSGNSGHAEVVEIKFNPKIINYSSLLDIFWKTIGGMGLTGIIVTVEFNLKKINSALINQKIIEFSRE